MFADEQQQLPHDSLDSNRCTLGRIGSYIVILLHHALKTKRGGQTMQTSFLHAPPKVLLNMVSDYAAAMKKFFFWKPMASNRSSLPYWLFALLPDCLDNVASKLTLVRPNLPCLANG